MAKKQVLTQSGTVMPAHAN